MTSLLLSFDLEEFTPPDDFGIAVKDRRELYEVSGIGLEAIVEVLEASGIRATFFTTLDFARTFPRLVGALPSKGHEIGFHGNKHLDDYGSMKDEEAELQLREGREALEREIGVAVRGFRSPRLSFTSYEVLERAGFRYDSSLHPTYVPGYYNNLLKSRQPFRKGGLAVVPISVLPVLRLPCHWVFFRNLGDRYSRLWSRAVMLGGNYLSIYFHPWEFCPDLSERYRGVVSFIFLRNTGKTLAERLEAYIRWCLARGLEARTFSEYISSMD